MDLLGKYIQTCILLHGLIHYCEEYFSSSGHMTGLLHFEIRLADELRGLVEHEEERLSRIRRFLNRIEFIDNNTGPYIENPINSYLMIKRLQDDWQELKKLIYSVYSTTLTRSIEQFPSENDLSGAKVALLRLQSVFVIPTRDIVEGIDQGGVKLSAEDAYEIGKLAYTRAQYKLCANWMNETLRLLDEGRYTRYINRSLIYHYMSWSEYENYDVETAIRHAHEWIRKVPEDSNALTIRDFLRKTLEEEKNQQPFSNQTKSNQPSRLFCTTYTPVDYDLEESREQALCRGETDPVPKKYARLLKCWFKNDHPLLILKPVRVELLYPKPEIKIFRSILSDAEMEAVKDIATPQLYRATVNNPQTGKPESIESRISKSAWLSPDEFDLVKRMDKRVEAVTGLDPTTAEPLQIANYGMGGHYERHFDFSRNVPLRPPPWKNRTETYLRIKPEEREFPKDGERIATLLYYMSNVAHGGATVFLNLGQAVRPSKGDALFWYNLNHDGSGDYETCHAACPVLFGEKWISNRWFRERGQEFRRKCNLRPEDD